MDFDEVYEKMNKSVKEMTKEDHIKLFNAYGIKYYDKSTLRGSVGYYFNHMRNNLVISFKAILLAMFHFVHAIIPVKYTSHEYYNIKLYKEE